MVDIPITIGSYPILDSQNMQSFPTEHGASGYTFPVTTSTGPITQQPTAVQTAPTAQEPIASNGVAVGVAVPGLPYPVAGHGFPMAVVPLIPNAGPSLPPLPSTVATLGPAALIATAPFPEDGEERKNSHGFIDLNCDSID